MEYSHFQFAVVSRVVRHFEIDTTFLLLLFVVDIALQVVSGSRVCKKRLYVVSAISNDLVLGLELSHETSGLLWYFNKEDLVDWSA